MDEPVSSKDRMEFTIFVSQIHPKIDERDLFEMFSLAGRVQDIRLIRDARTNKSKGLAYIEFEKREDVAKGVALNGQLLGGYPITVNLIQPPKPKSDAASLGKNDSLKLHIDNLHHNISDIDLKNLFEPFGPLDFVEVSRDQKRNSRGFGFVQFQRSADARMAINALNNFEVAGRNIKVGISTAQPDGSVGADIVAMAGPTSGTVLDLGYGAAAADQFAQLRSQAVLSVTPADSSALDEDGGVALSAHSRAQLMQSLQQRKSVIDTYLPQAPPPPVVPRVQVSTCIIIKNMFSPAEETEPNWDQDIKEDVSIEAGKHGRLKHVFVDKNSAGHVYLRYEDTNAAQMAVAALNGRWFGSRQISAEYMPEATYLLKFPAAK